MTSIDIVDDKKIEEEVATQEYFKKSEVIISPLDDYNIELNVMEKFVIDERIKGNNIHHSNLPIPSVVKLSDPSNLDNNIIVRNIKLSTENRLSLSQEIIDKINNILLENKKLKNENLSFLSKAKESEINMFLKSKESVLGSYLFCFDKISGFNSKNIKQ